MLMSLGFPWSARWAYSTASRMVAYLFESDASCTETLYALFQIWKRCTVSNSGWSRRISSTWVSNESRSLSLFWDSLLVQRNMTRGPPKPPRSSASEKLSRLATRDGAGAPSGRVRVICALRETEAARWHTPDHASAAESGIAVGTQPPPDGG